MKTYPLIFVACIFGASNFAQDAVSSPDRKVVEAAVIAMVPSGPGSASRGPSLPFSAGDAVEYFSTVLEMSPEKELDGARVFESQHDPRPEDRWRIVVRAEEKVLIVEFTVADNVGLSLAREFFESSLFEREESEELYGMLGHAEKGPVEKLRRFTVGMTSKETKSVQILTLRFTPASDDRLTDSEGHKSEKASPKE